MRKRINKIGVTIMLVFCMAIMLSPSVIAVDLEYTVSSSGDGIGLENNEEILFDFTNNEIEMLGAEVGIGTTSPRYELEVNGDAWLSGGSTARRLAISTTNNRYFLQVEDATFDGIGFYKATPTPQVWLMVVTNSGRVGIGTTSPSYDLHVVGDGYFSDDLTVADLLTVGGDGSIGDDLTVTDDLNVDSGTLFVDANLDNVGVGTSSPDTLFHVKSGGPIVRIECSDESSARLEIMNDEDSHAIVSNDNELAIWDETGILAQFGRGTVGTGDPDITFMTLKNSAGTTCYIYPDAAGTDIVVTTTHP